MKIPKEYTKQEREAYERGWLESRQSIYSENGVKGGRNRWEGVSLEERVKYAKMLVEARKGKRLDSAIPANT